MRIELQNISGLRGNHKFGFEDGLSILHAPNGSGKSSLLNAFHLIIGNYQIPQQVLNNYLTEREINGYVKLFLKDKEYEVQIQRKGDKVSITYSNVDGELFKFPSEELSYIRAKSELYQGIITNREDIITSWFYQVTQVHKYNLFLEIATDILSELKFKRDDLKKKVNKDVSRNQEEVNRLKVENEELNQKVEEILNSDEYIQFMKDHREKKDDIDGFRKNLKQLRDKKNRLYDGIFKDESNLKNIKKELEDNKLQLKNFDAEYPIKKAQLDKNEKLKDQLEEKIGKINKQRLKNQETLTYERNLLKDYKTLLKRDSCPTCHQKLDNVLIKDLVGKGDSTVKKLESDIKKLRNEEKDLSAKIEEIETELIELTNFLKQNINEIKKNLKNNEEKIKKISENLSNKKQGRNETSEKIEITNAQLIKIQEELAKDNPLQNDILKLQGESSNKEKLIRKLEEELEESSEHHLEYLKSEKYVKRSDEIHQFFTEKVRHLETETMEKTSDALKNSFELLELARLKKIEFNKKDGNYILEIVRDNNVYTTLEKLSGAEKSLITLIITWIVKQMVIPNEPIFLVDEVTTEMDDTRFKDILNYISEKTDYVIVARHKPYKGKREILSVENIVSIST